MPRERGEQEAQRAFNTMREWVQQGLQAGTVSNWVLEGPIGDTRFQMFAGVFPRVNPREESGYVAAGQSRYDRNALNRRILALRLPDRVANMQVVEDERVENGYEQISAMLELPSIVLGIGQARERRDEVVVLFTVPGRPPQRALEILQNRVRSRMHKLN